MDPISLALLPWALWATMETFSVPMTGAAHVQQEIIHRFATYQQCDEAATWAESQPDLREDYAIINSKKFRSTMTYDCRRAGR